MNDEHPSAETEWPVPSASDRDPALAALEAAWRTGAPTDFEQPA